MKPDWDSLFAGGCRPADAARLMGCGSSEARRRLDMARARYNAARTSERCSNRAATAVSNDASYTSMHLWGVGKLGRGVSLEKTGDVTFAHMIGR